MNGFNLEKELAEQSKEDYIFGGTSAKCIAKIPAQLREHYLPKGERQNIGSEKMDCATRSVINLLETKFNYLYKNGKTKNALWLKENGYANNGEIEFSDRYIAILSGTTRQGNSLKAPLQAIHKHGLIPKSLFPQVNDFEEYYDKKKITPEMTDIGLTFSQLFSTNYDKVYDEVPDMLDSAGYAWAIPINGIYPRTENSPNHAFLRFKKDFIFDNYEESKGDWIKQLAPDYKYLPYSYRVFIPNEYNFNKKQPNWVVELLDEIISLINDIIKLSYGAVKKTVGAIKGAFA